MNALKWLLLAPFRLIGVLCVAFGYLLGFLFGVALLAGGTALCFTGEGAILGIPALIIGYLVLRDLFHTQDRERQERHPVHQAPTPAPAVQQVAHCYPPPGSSRHYRRQPQYLWSPGHWTMR